MFTTKDDVIDLVKIQMSTAASTLTSDGLESAVDTALQELGWAVPISDEKKCFWLTKRSIRHACYILLIASAMKFKYKQVNLQHRFDHFEKLIKSMDTEFEEAQASDASIFSSVDSYKQFGTQVDAGFRYDVIGRDITYDDANRYLTGVL